MKDLTSTTVERYQIVEQLGGGGMANVYKAFHPDLEVHHALKVIRPELVEVTGFKERFQREARAIAGLRHPNIVGIHHSGQHNDLFFMAMEFVEGEDLKALIEREGPVRPFTRAVDLIDQIGDALDYAHQKGVVHRDIKPANILLTHDGQPIVTDFGIARMVESDEKLTQTGVGIGTPAYMAPEQAMGEVTPGPSVDLYSLGVLLYVMLTGEAPFKADTPLAVLYRVINDPIPAPQSFSPDIPQALQDVVMKAMSKDPALRYPTGKAFAEAARRSLGADSTATAETTVAAPATVQVAGGRAASTTTAAAAPLPPVPPPSTAPGTNPPFPDRGATSPSAEARGSKAPWIVLGLMALLVLGGLATAVGLAAWWLRSNDRAPSAAETESIAATETPGRPASEPPARSADVSTDTAELSAGVSAEVPGTGSDPRAGGPSTASADPRGVPSGESSAVPGTPATGESSAVPGTPATGNEATGTAARPLAAPAEAMAGAQPPPAATGSAVPGTVVEGAPGELNERLIDGGSLGWGQSVSDRLEPDEEIAYDLDVRRRTVGYFDIETANRRARYTLYSPSGEQVFDQLGADFGPMTLEPGVYRLVVSPQDNLPLTFQFQFRPIG